MDADAFALLSDFLLWGLILSVILALVHGRS